MTFAGRNFNDVTNNVKIAEGVGRDGQAKELSKRANNFGAHILKDPIEQYCQQRQLSLQCSPL